MDASLQNFSLHFCYFFLGNTPKKVSGHVQMFSFYYKNHCSSSRNPKHEDIKAFTPGAKITNPGEKLPGNNRGHIPRTVSPRTLNMCILSSDLTAPRDQKDWSKAKLSGYFKARGARESLCTQNSQPLWLPLCHLCHPADPEQNRMRQAAMMPWGNDHAPSCTARAVQGI